MRKAAVIAVILAQALVLAWMAGKYEWIVRTAPTIWLRTVPVDPRNLFRGDYVSLNYEIATIPGEKFGPALQAKIAAAQKDEYPRRDQETVVFTALNITENGLAEVAGVDLTPPASGLFIKGRVQRWTMEPSALTRVAYGIDSFFVEQGQGRKLERVPEGTPEGVAVSLEMRAALGPDGTAVLTDYRWAALGLGLDIRKGRRAGDGVFPRTPAMTLTFYNAVDEPMAIVLPADRRTLRLQSRNSWSGPVAEAPLIQSGAPLTDADVRVLQAGESLAVEMDFSPEWLQSLEKEEIEFFHLIYAAPPVAACAHLKEAGKIWRGQLAIGESSYGLWEK